jgi:hypothetical protein
MIPYFFCEIIVYQKKIGYNKLDDEERKVFPMEEREILVFADEDNQEIQMEILDYFEYDGQEYALLVEAEEDDDHVHDHECSHEHDHDEDDEKSIFIMKVIVDGETEEFVPVEDEKMDELVEVLQEMLNEDMGDGDDDDEDDDEIFGMDELDDEE